jgi:hypothetical protein
METNQGVAGATQTTETLNLPRWQCHKEVRAVQIAAIQTLADGTSVIAPADSDVARINTDASWTQRFRLAQQQQAAHGQTGDNGYYVVYPDGYASWSPTQAFEEGYTRVPETRQGRM